MRFYSSTIEKVSNNSLSSWMSMMCINFKRPHDFVKKNFTTLHQNRSTTKVWKYVEKLEICVQNRVAASCKTGFLLTVVMDFATADTMISCNETGYPGFVSGGSSFRLRTLHLQTGIDFWIDNIGNIGSLIGMASIGMMSGGAMMSCFVIWHFKTVFFNTS